MRLYLIICVVLLTSCLGTRLDRKALIQPVELGQTFAIINIDVFNGIDSIIQQNQTVLIDKGKIRFVADPSRVPSDIAVVNGAGKYLVPGFVDSHVHLMASGSAPWSMVRPDPEHNLEAWLAAGVTTIYDLGGIASQSKKYRDKIDQGQLIGPSIYFTGSPITSPEGHPITASKALLPFPLSLFIGFLIETADEKTDYEKLIRSYQKSEVDYIKIIHDQLPEGDPELSARVMDSLISETHDQGFSAFVHIGSVKNLRAALMANADVFAHFPYKGKLTISMAERLRAAGKPVVFTYGGFLNTYLISKGQYVPTDLDQRLQPAVLYSSVKEAAGLAINDTEVLDRFSQTLRANQPHWEANLRLLRKYEVPFAIGTDSPLPGAYAGSSFHEELILLQNLGFSPYELMRAATADGANLFLDEPTFGVIAEGKAADLLILQNNPLVDVRNCESIELVIKSGKAYKPVY